MSAFICARCDGFRDADDGCKEAPGFRLICADCMADEEEERVIASTEAGQPTPSPTGTELALIEAKRHIDLLTRLSTDDPLWQDAAECARAFISDAPTEGDIFADLFGRITDGRNEYRSALEKIAEGRDAGRHDGLREECPLHDQYTMWLDARAALEKESSADERDGTTRNRVAPPSQEGASEGEGQTALSLHRGK